MKIHSTWLVTAGLMVLIGAGCQQQVSGPQISPTKACIDARDALLSAAEADDPVTRANAIEALADTLGSGAGHVYVQGLKDPNPVVRYSAALAVAETRYQPARDALLAMARNDRRVGEPDKRVLAAVVYALSRLGDDQHLNHLGPLLFDQEPEVRAAAAMVMGRIGNRSAIPPLTSRLSEEQDPMVELQLVESLALLGDEAAIIQLEAYTRRRFVDERLVAIPTLAHVGGTRAIYVLRDMFDDDEPARVRAAAAAGLAELDRANDVHYNYLLMAARDPMAAFAKEPHAREIPQAELYSLQQIAALGLGEFDNTAAVDVLHDLLASRDGSVRVAAAQSILELLPEFRNAQPARVTEPEPLMPAEPADQAVPAEGGAGEQAPEVAEPEAPAEPAAPAELPSPAAEVEPAQDEAVMILTPAVEEEAAPAREVPQASKPETPAEEPEPAEQPDAQDEDDDAPVMPDLLGPAEGGNSKLHTSGARD
jgi:HEAT repeat protein